ncbi:MAG: hypothetical protein JWN52_67 [Actinomycetia bacterium]|nr:hypothetical protein [Actinomycetes bacterium]
MTTWRKSRRSSGNDNGSCVELATLGLGTVGIRDSKNTALPHLTFSRGTVAALAAKIREGQYDR